VYVYAIDRMKFVTLGGRDDKVRVYIEFVCVYINIQTKHMQSS